jgi:ATP-dependent DNA helicase RecG
LSEVFSEHKVAVIHGKLKPQEKSAIMNAFKAKEIMVLIATTVIEVGIDVPEANMMVIEHAERFGLAQLHQLRGRVGRGQKQSYCYLMGKAKSSDSRKRIKALCDYTDGFKLAEIDMTIRGSGEFYGTRQSGIPAMRFADLMKNEPELLLAKKIAAYVLKQGLSKYKEMLRVLKEKHLHIIDESAMN